MLLLSATSTSTLIPLSARNPIALRTHVATVSASLRQGMTTVSSTFRLLQSLRICLDGPVQFVRRITVGEGRTRRTGRLLVVRVHQPSTGGYGLRVMPAAASRQPTARRAWSIWPNKPGRPGWTTRTGARQLAARAWAGHRLFIIVLTPAVLLRIDAELGYQWHAWFNDSFQYVQNTVHFNLDPTRVSGYSIWLKILQPLHTYAVVTILQHLMAVAIAVMIYALARRRFRTPAWLATLATVPVLYAGFEIQLEHLIMADVPFLPLLTLAVTLLLWDPGPPAPSLRRCVLIGALLGLAEVMRSVGLPLLAVFAVYMIIKRISWRKVGATIAVCLIPVFVYAGLFYMEHGQFAMTESTGVFLYSRVMTFADCTKMKVPVNELSL